MQNPVFYGAFLAISWIKPRSVVTNYSECMRSNSAYRDAYVTRSQTQSLVCLWLCKDMQHTLIPDFMFTPLTRTVREVRSSDQDKTVADSKVLESLLTVLHALHNYNDTQSPKNRQCSGLMYDALGYEIKRLDSTIPGAGKGVFVTKGKVPARSLVALYPGIMKKLCNFILTNCHAFHFKFVYENLVIY